MQWRASHQSILIPGVAGGVGSTLALFARSKGVKVIGTTSTPEKEAFALSNGVDHLVRGDSKTLPSQIMEVTNGEGVDLAIDQLGGDSLISCIRSLAPMGMVVSINVITHAHGGCFQRDARLAFQKSISAHFFNAFV